MATRGALLVREEVGTGTEAAGRLEGGADRLAVLVMYNREENRDCQYIY